MKSRRCLPLFAAFLLTAFGCSDTPSTSSAKRENLGEPDKLAPPETPGRTDKSTAGPTTPRVPPEPLPVHAWDKALARATVEGKLIFIEFSAPWCGPCQQMKRTTFAHTLVQARLTSYVTLFVDTDQEPDLTRQFGVRGIPAYYVVRADRLIVKTGSGYKDANDFLRWLDGTK